jgi:uncharacterized protein YecT (DUF1311 family)
MPTTLILQRRGKYSDADQADGDAAATFSRADASLNEVYQKAVGHMKESGRDLKPLVTAERAWIVERDAIKRRRNMI